MSRGLLASPHRFFALATNVACFRHQANQGSAGGLSYYRDRSGAEVDLVVERPDAAVLVE